MGVSRYLKEQNPDVQIVGLQPAEGAAIAGIRRWPKQYLPKIFEARRSPGVIPHAISSILITALAIADLT